MSIWEIVKQTWRDVHYHRLRTILALFGIIWGTLSVILLLALGQGFYEAGKKNMQEFSQRLLVVFTGERSLAYQGLSKGSPLLLTIDDILTLPQAVPSVQASIPMLSKSVSIRYQNQEMSVQLQGTIPEYGFFIRLAHPLQGRFITSLDEQHYQPVAFLTAAVKQKLFGKQNPLGKKVQIGENFFTVVGFMEKGRLAFEAPNTVFIPNSAWLQQGSKRVFYFYIQPKAGFSSAFVKQSLLQYLAFQYHFDIKDKTALQFWDSSGLSSFVEWFLRGIQLFLGFCGAMTLGVGAVGLTNTLYLIVTQRQAEIGLRMALGATSSHILKQFLLEALLLLLTAVTIGIVLSLFILTILQSLSLPDWLGTPHISGWVILGTVSILVSLGLLACYFPARKAASLTPIEALSL